MTTALALILFLYLMGAVRAAEEVNRVSGKVMDEFEMDDWADVGLWPALAFIDLIKATWSE